MQNYIDVAEKNGVTLYGEGSCQLCGANTTRGVHECVEIFSLGFQLIDYSKPENHIYRFLSVDAHTLQHSEIHGRWNNHFHLTRQHLIFEYKVAWNYGVSPKLSDHLNTYKADRSNEFLNPPKVLERGSVTTTDVRDGATNEAECQAMIEKWGQEVYQSWNQYHELVDKIAQGFLDKNRSQLPKIKLLLE
ncbi:MAG: DUF5946 family protein [Bacteroidota bacterium]